MFIIPYLIIVILRHHHVIAPAIVSFPIGLLAIVEGAVYGLLALLFLIITILTWDQVRR